MPKKKPDSAKDKSYKWDDDEDDDDLKDDDDPEIGTKVVAGDGDDNDDDDEDNNDGDDDKKDSKASESDNESEMKEIEQKLQKGEDIAAVPDSETSLLPKSRVIYCCPLSRKIFYKNKWIKDTVTDLYTIRTELAVCDQLIDRAKKVGYFIGSIEIYDKFLDETKGDIVNLVKTVEAELENRMPFDVVIDIKSANGILYVFTNTTRLAAEISRSLRQERGGAIQYEWFERNQFVRAKWYTQVQNREYFRSRIRAAKEKRIGMFNFEEE